LVLHRQGSEKGTRGLSGKGNKHDMKRDRGDVIAGCRREGRRGESGGAVGGGGGACVGRVRTTSGEAHQHGRCSTQRLQNSAKYTGM